MTLCASSAPWSKRRPLPQCLTFPCLADRVGARTLCLLSMLGGSLSISCSRCAQRSESRGSSAPDQAVASARVPHLCAHCGARTRARRGSSPRVL
eukprot:1535638-Prymnesium_polylepis.1